MRVYENFDALLRAACLHKFLTHSMCVCVRFILYLFGKALIPRKHHSQQKSTTQMRKYRAHNIYIIKLNGKSFRQHNLWVVSDGNLLVFVRVCVLMFELNAANIVDAVH